MTLWISVILAWVGVNIVLVALMWRYQWMKERSARQSGRSEPAPSAGQATPGHCPHAQAGWRCQPPERAGSRPGAGAESQPVRPRFVALSSADAVAGAWAGQSTCAFAAHAACRVHELHEEIRVLKLTVAELALDKAMLSAAVSRRKAVS